MGDKRSSGTSVRPGGRLHQVSRKKMVTAQRKQGNSLSGIMRGQSISAKHKHPLRERESEVRELGDGQGWKSTERCY